MTLLLEFEILRLTHNVSQSWHRLAIIISIGNYTTNHHLHEHQHQPHPQSIHPLRRRFPRHQVRRAHLIHTLHRLKRPHRRGFPQYHPSCDPRLAGMATAAEVED